MKGRQTRSGLVKACLLPLALAGALPPPAVAAPDPVRTAQDVARSLGLQLSIPGDDGRLATPRTESAPAPEHPPIRTFDFDAANILRFVLYIAIGIGIVFAFWTMRDRLPVLGSRRLVARDKAPKRAADPSIDRMVEAQMEADELARRGRLAEAMHVLLLRSLVEVRKRLNVSFADSLTSREILKALSLSEAGKSSLADIVRRVELVYFGDHEAGEGDYSACRRSYEHLLRAMRAGAA